MGESVTLEIWQPRPETLEGRRVMFTEEIASDPGAYALVWREELRLDRTQDKFRDAILEEQFIRFNIDSRPAGRFMRSMSVGDIVRLDDQAWLCLSLGFKQVDWAPPQGLPPLPAEYRESQESADPEIRGR